MKRWTSIAVVALVVLVGSVLLASGSAGRGGGTFSRHDVKVFFTRASAMETDCSRTKAFSRTTVGSDVLHDSIVWLMRGPRPGERKDGATSFFSDRTSGLVNDVWISEGTAYVDFDDLRRVISQASSSCGSASLLAELDRTVKQFPTVDRAVYSLEGSTTAFYEWLQLSAPE